MREMRGGKQAISVRLSVVLAGVFLLLATGAGAQSPMPATRLARAAVVPDNEPAPVRPARRLRIYPRDQAGPDGVYPRYNPGPNAVRVCNATYVPEYRPSGTVIVQRVNCVWRRG